MSKGFTLIELLTASLVIMMISAFTYYLYSASLRNIGSSDRYLSAVLRTSSVIEDVRKMPFPQISGKDGASFDEGKGIIGVEREGNDLVMISVRYTWDPNRRPLALETLKSRY